MDEKILIDILDSNEKRANKQKQLIEKYKNSLISFTLNIPGRVKDNPNYRKIHMDGVRIIGEVLKENSIDIVYIEENVKITGREAYIVVEADEYKLKKAMIDIEDNHPIGRILDIDIFNSKNQQISRSDINKPLRRCLICEKNAIICMREKNHTYEELVDQVNIICEKYKGN